MKTITQISLLSAAIVLAGCHAVQEQPSDQSAGDQHTGSNQPQVNQPLRLDDTAVEAKKEQVLIAEEMMAAEQDSTYGAGAPAMEKAKAKHDAFTLSSQTMPAAAQVRQLAGQMHPSPVAPPIDRENYQHFEDNGLKLVAEHPVSTFSIDVDTGSYSNVRRFLNQGQLPRQDAVRVEELINYFNYDYQAPRSEDTPFAVYTELAPSPWREKSLLMHIGLKGYDISRDNLPPANLVFLIDVSGSMNSTNKIGLLKQGFKLLTKQLRPQDTISIAVYAGASGVVLEPTSGDQKAKIQTAIEQLRAGGSTNGAAGIKLAYQLAKSKFDSKGINRVILATDGDFNVGTVNFEALTELVEAERNSGIALTTLGFGTGNYNDHLMEQLADKGNGNYAYIDNLQEARKVLVEELGSTLQTIAKDVKIQVEFNPQRVSSYRLIGYENRALKREDFNNDKVDAGDIGAGHTVTAIYELDLVGSGSSPVDPLRYGQPETNRETINNAFDQELAFLKLRYKKPDASNSQLIQAPVKDDDQIESLAQASEPFRFAVAVAGFGQLLRGGNDTGSFDYDDVVDLGLAAKGKDEWGYRSEFINLVRLAKTIAQ